MDNKENQNEESNEDKITQKDFENFLKEKNINIENNGTQMYENFLLFQKFMNCIINNTSSNSISKKEDEPNENKNIIQTENIEHIDTNNEPEKNVENPIKESIFEEENKAVNYDDIPIKGTQINFVELVENNLAELKYIPESRDREFSNEPKFKYKKKNLKQLSKSAKINKNEVKKKTISKTSKNFKNFKPVFSNTLHKDITTCRSVEILKEKKKEESSIHEESFDTINEDESVIINRPMNENLNKQLIYNREEEEKNNSLIIRDENQPIVITLDNENEGDNDEVIYNYSGGEEEEINVQNNMPTLNIEKEFKKFENFEKNMKIKKNNKNLVLKNIFDKELKILQDEKNEVAKIKTEYVKMKKQLNKEMAEFSQLKQKEFSNFEKWKEEEIKKIRKTNLQSYKSPNHFNADQIVLNNKNKKNDKEIIEQLRNQLTRTQQEIKKKENINKQNIDKLKKQLNDANHQINELMKISRNNQKKIIISGKKLHQLTSNENDSLNQHNEFLPLNRQFAKSEIFQPHKSQNKMTLFNNSNKLVKEEKDNYDLIFPLEYEINSNIKILSEEKLSDVKIIKKYQNNAKEIIFSSGVKKQIFEDGYQIIFFTNKDIKQIFPNGKSVYYFYDAKTTQTTYPNNLHVYKLQNGTIEKHYPNGTKEIISASKTLEKKTESKENAEKKEIKEKKKKEKTGAIIIERGDGTREIRFPDGGEVFEFS